MNYGELQDGLQIYSNFNSSVMLIGFFADPAYPSYENIVELINGR